LALKALSYREESGFPSCNKVPWYVRGSAALPAPQLMDKFSNYIAVGGVSAWKRNVWNKFIWVFSQRRFRTGIGLETLS